MKTGKALTVETASRMVKNCCHSSGLHGQYSAHTLCKTWDYAQRVRFDATIALLMKAFGHNSERETLAYLGILPAEVLELYRNVV